MAGADVPFGLVAMRSGVVVRVGRSVVEAWAQIADSRARGEPRMTSLWTPANRRSG